MTYRESTEFPIGPDGMAFGTNGNLYVTVFGQGDVTVLSPEGEVVERIFLREDGLRYFGL
ncbi:hypothetical protein BH18ACT11_BH18ACT11_02890 [soil metagenome]